jgi:hypothetical protein
MSGSSSKSNTMIGVGSTTLGRQGDKICKSNEELCAIFTMCGMELLLFVQLIIE